MGSAYCRHAAERAAPAHIAEVSTRERPHLPTRRRAECAAAELDEATLCALRDAWFACKETFALTVFKAPTAFVSGKRGPLKTSENANSQLP